MTIDYKAYEVGYDIPALPGMTLEEIFTPALIIDLDAFEDNIERLRDFCFRHDVRHRAHAKMHKSVDVARYQLEHGAACGICCQKVSEAEVFARAGIKDILVSNQVTRIEQIERLARLASTARMLVCVDEAENVLSIAGAAQARGVTIEVLVEIDVGARRCGVEPGADAAELASLVAAQPSLKFAGLQAYHGPAQHFKTYGEREAAVGRALTRTSETIEALAARGLACDIVAGGGTGTFMLDGSSGVYNEIQAGSYAFMDASYASILDPYGKPSTDFRHALFLLTSVISKPIAERAVCDAGLKSQTTESGLPFVHSRPEISVVGCNDEHTILHDPDHRLSINERLALVPSHCDPTCNLHNWYVCVRDDVVETLWPVSARGKSL